jgi:hypothetical protein
LITTATDIRTRLLDGLPPLVQGMAEGILIEWARAVSAVPELERLAEEDLGSLADLPVTERELALRRRWQRLTEAPAVELPGRPAARPARVLQPAMTTP